MLVEADDPEDPYDIERIKQAISLRLDVVEIAADPSDNVHRIFESLNNTGMSLSQADLLRNYLFMLMPNCGEEVYRQLWLPMQDRLGAERLELLAWLDLVLRGNERIRRDEVYREQQRRLNNLNGDEAAVRAEVAELPVGRDICKISSTPTASLISEFEALLGGSTRGARRQHIRC